MMYLEEDYGKIAIISDKGRARRQARRKARRKKRVSRTTLKQRRRRQRLLSGGVYLNLLPPILIARIAGAIRRSRVEKGTIKSEKKLRRYRSMLQKRIARLKGRDRQMAKDRIAEAKKLINQINQQLSKKGGDDMGFYGNLGTNTSSAIRKGLIPVVTPQSYMMQSYAGLGFYPGAYAGLGFYPGAYAGEDEDAPVEVTPEPGIVGKVVQGVKNYPEWWKQQNLFVQIAVPTAFLFALYQIPAVKRRAKKMMKKGR